MFQVHTTGRPTLIGMIHLGALPGSPRFGGSLADVIATALADAESIIAGGFDALMVENYFDTPFFQDQVPPLTTAAMTRCAGALRDKFPGVPLGINVLRNDAIAALSVATAVDAEMIRVNVLSGAAVTDQGIIQSRAAELIRLRASLNSDVQVWADVGVKHARQLGTESLSLAAQDMVFRGHADAVIVSGAATGAPTDAQDVDMVRTAVPQVPLIIGSGVSPDNLPNPGCHGMIVGTTLKEGPRVSQERVELMVRLVEQTYSMG